MHLDGTHGPPEQMVDGIHVRLWGTGSASREFLHAADCARAIGIALEKKTGADPINLGTGNEITIRDLAMKIKEVGRYNANIMWDPTKPDGQPRRCLDISRAKNVLRWEPRIPFDVGLAGAIHWYRQNK
jgi:GDP-L-fucose synthase